MGPLTPGAKPMPTSSISAEASVGGLDFNEDPVTVTQGRMADPHKADEFVIDAASAKALGYHLGETVPIGWVTNAQTASGNFNPNQPDPGPSAGAVKLVGISEGQATTLFQDQDSANGQSIMLFTPALTNKLLDCCSNDMVSALTLQGGDRHLSAVEAEVKRALPKGLPFVYVESQSIIATANATLRPETIALGVFGGIAGVAALLIAGQVISRRIRLRAPELDIARALGADPPMTLWDGLLGTLGAVLLGSLLAGAVAVGLSPLGPLGPVRPFLGVALRPDWAVIGLGVLAWCSSSAAWPCWRRSARCPTGPGTGRAGSPRHGSRRRPPGPASHRRRSPACASRSSRGWDGAPCRCARPSSAPFWR